MDKETSRHITRSSVFIQNFDCLVGWLLGGWLVYWLVGLSIRLLVGRSVGRLVGFSVGSSVALLVIRYVGFLSVGRWVSWLVGWSVGLSISWLIGRSVGWSVGSSFVRSVAQRVTGLPRIWLRLCHEKEASSLVKYYLLYLKSSIFKPFCIILSVWLKLFFKKRYFNESI